MRRLQKVSDDTRIQRIMQVLDEDSDGVIDINDALKVGQMTWEQKYINPCWAKFLFLGNCKNKFAFSIIFYRWDGAGGWNASLWNTKI